MSTNLAHDNFEIVLETVQKNYVDEVNVDALVDRAIGSMYNSAGVAPLPDSDLLSHSYSLQPIGPLARFSRAYDYLRSHVIKHETSQLSAQSKHEESPSDEHQVSIGLLLARDGEWIRIAAVTIGSAAETVGINRGDAIVAINGQSTSGKSLSWCYQQLSGEEGSVVEVSVYAETGDQIDYRVIRTRVNVPYVVMLSRPLV